MSKIKDAISGLPITALLLSLFYTAATLFGIVGLALLAMGEPIPLIPFEMTFPALFIEVFLFLFLAYGIFKGWKFAWFACILANLIWLMMDLPKMLGGNAANAVPVLIAVVSLVFLATPGFRKHCGISKA